MVQTKQSKKKSVLCFQSLPSLFLGAERGFPAHREARPHLLRLAVLIMRGGKVLGAKKEEDRNSICEAWQRSGIFLFEFLA